MMACSLDPRTLLSVSEMEGKNIWPWKKKAQQFMKSNEPFKGHGIITQANVKVRILAEQVLAQDELVEQYLKVAQEAVIGWQSAECLVEELNRQLKDQVINATGLQRQVSQLELELKNCMQHLRESRNQELKLQKLIACKTKELEELQCELEQAKASNIKVEPMTDVDNVQIDLKFRQTLPSGAVEEAHQVLEETSKKQQCLDIRKSDGSWEACSPSFTNERLTVPNQRESLIIDKDVELQAVRFVCADLGTKSEGNKSSQPDQIVCSLSQASNNRCSRSHEEAIVFNPLVHGAGDEMNCSESWALALLSKLGELGKEKQGRLIFTRSYTPGKSNLLDDFEEMEKLAALPLCNNHSVDETCTSTSQVLLDNCKCTKDKYECQMTQAEKVDVLSSECDHLRTKVAFVENELKITKLQNLETKASLSSVENRLLEMLGTETDGKLDSLTLQKIRTVFDMISKPFNNGMESPDTISCSTYGEFSHSSEESPLKNEIYRSIENHFFLDLLRAIRRVVSLFGKLPTMEFTDAHSLPDRSDALPSLTDTKLAKAPEFKSCIRGLITVCEGALHNKVDVNDFLEETASTLEWLVCHVLPLPDELSKLYN